MIIHNNKKNINPSYGGRLINTCSIIVSGIIIIIIYYYYYFIDPSIIYLVR